MSLHCHRHATNLPPIQESLPTQGLSAPPQTLSSPILPPCLPLLEHRALHLDFQTSMAYVEEESGSISPQGLPRTLGFVPTELQRTFFATLFNFCCSLHPIEPLHRQCSAPGLPAAHLVVKAVSRKAVTGAPGTRHFSGCEHAHCIRGVRESHCQSHKTVAMERVESENTV